MGDIAALAGFLLYGGTSRFAWIRPSSLGDRPDEATW
jgi:hypothetical protein